MSSPCPIALSAAQSPDRVALRCEGSAWTYAELDSWVGRLSAALSEAGVQARDRVAVLSHNRPELVPLLFALRRLRAVAVMLNARLTAAELTPQLETAKVTITLAEDASVALIDGARPLSALLDAAELENPRAAPERLSPGGISPAPTDVTRGEDELFAILFTSGTTGRAKAAALTWGNFLAAADASASNIGGNKGDAWLLCLPVFHVGGLTMVVRAARYGCTLVMHRRFDPPAVDRSFDQDAITHASLVTVQLQRLLDARGDRSFHPRLRAILIGGGPVPIDLLRRARSLGAPVLQTYGLTEACAQVTTERPADADGTTAGFPLPGTEVRVVDQQGAPLPPGEIGEVEVRGPTVFAGYLADESETHQTLWKGWLRTKDLGSLDARGRLRIVARRTDLILSGGENIYPAELEAVLLSAPGVREAAVIGVEDARWGQVPAAIVVGTTTPESLTEHCAQLLAGYKRPRTFLFVPELPRNATGKVDRPSLRALLSANVLRFSDR